MMIRLSPVSLYTEKYTISDTNKYMWINPHYIAAMEPIDKRYRDHLYEESKAPYDETLSGTMLLMSANFRPGSSLGSSSMLFVQESVEEIVYKLNKLEVGVA